MSALLDDIEVDAAAEACIEARVALRLAERKAVEARQREDKLAITIAARNVRDYMTVLREAEVAFARARARRDRVTCG